MITNLKEYIFNIIIDVKETNQFIIDYNFIFDSTKKTDLWGLSGLQNLKYIVN